MTGTKPSDSSERINYVPHWRDGVPTLNDTKCVEVILEKCHERSTRILMHLNPAFNKACICT